MAQRERRIQEIAYLLWEQEGRPDGQSDRFWHAAVVQFEAEFAPSEIEFSPAEGAHEAPVEARPDTPAPEQKSRAPAKAKPVPAEAEKPAPAAKPKVAKAPAASPKAAEAPPAAAKAAESAPPAKPTAKPRATAAKRKPTV